MELTNKDILNNQQAIPDKDQPIVDKDIKKEKVDFVDINKKGFDFEKAKFVLFPFILLVLGISVIGFVTYPKIQEYYANLTVIETKEAEITKLSDKLKVLQQFSTVGNVLEENSAVLTKAIPNEQTVPQFMTLVQTISKNSGVELKSLTYSGTAPTSEKSSLSTTGLSEIELVYIQGSAVGDYNSIKTFTRNLESSMRIMNIDNVRLTSDGSAEQSKVNLSFAITAYSAIIKAQAVAEQPLNFNLTDGNFSKVLDFLKSQNDYNVDVADVGIGKVDPFAN
jgi:Tfp pilus assembly protein PilO